MAESIIIISGRPTPTYSMESSDIAQSLLNNEGAVYALVTPETGDIRFSFTSTPTNNPPLGHILRAGDSLILQSGTEVSSFLFLSLEVGSPALIQITIGFER